MTRKTMANVVTMSIKGLFKAFKNMVKAEDVILLHGQYIEHTKDSKLNKLKEALPELGDVENDIKKARNNSAAWSKLNTRFQRVSKDDDYKASKECQTAIDLWRNFTKQYPTGAALDKKFGTDPKVAFKGFFNDYADFRHRYFFEKSVTAEDVFESEAIAVSYDIMRSLFESDDPTDCIDAVFEDEQLDESKKFQTFKGIDTLEGGQDKKLKRYWTMLKSEASEFFVNNWKSKYKKDLSPQGVGSDPDNSAAVPINAELGRLSDIEKTATFKDGMLDMSKVQEAKDKGYEFFMIFLVQIPKWICTKLIGSGGAYNRNINKKSPPISELIKLKGTAGQHVSRERPWLD